MIEQVEHIVVAITLAVLAFLKPIECDLYSLLLIFFLNFLFGYLSGMVANNEEFNLRKALRCLGEAAVFFILCCSIYFIGRLKGEMTRSIQCVSCVTYIIIYFYALNVLKNLKKMFKKETTPWFIVAFLYYVLRVKFIERIPFLSNFLNMQKNEL